MIGISVGLALRGFAPVPEIQFDGFTYPAFDQMVSHLAKYRTRSRSGHHAGHGAHPFIWWHRRGRAPFRVHRDVLGAHARIESCCPVHAGGCLLVAARFDRCPDPVMFLEPKRRYWGAKGWTQMRRPWDRAGGGAPGRHRRHRADLRRAGGHVAVGCRVGGAATGWEREVVDLRRWFRWTSTRLPVDRRTGRFVVLHEGPRTLGMGRGWRPASKRNCSGTQAPVLRATGFDTPYPPARLEKLWLPGPDRLLDCVGRALEQP